MIRILLVDDQNLVQQGIKSLLDQDPEIKVVGAVKDGRSAVMQLNDLHPDIVLLDIEMPGMNGITTTKYITHLAPQTKVIILTSHEDKKYLTQALMAGAKAYILKSSLIKDLKQSIIAVNNGYSHIESRLLAKIFDPSNIKQSDRSKNNHQPKPLSRQLKSEIQQPQEIDNSTIAHETDLANQQPPVLPEETTKADLSDDALSNQPVKMIKATPVSHNIQSTSNISHSQSAKIVPKINLLHLPSVEVDDFPLKNDSVVTANIENSTDTTNNLLSTAVQNSTSQLLTAKNHLNESLVVIPNDNHPQYREKLSNIAQYPTKLARLWAAKKLQYEPIINRYQVRFIAQYKSQLLPLLKQWHEKGWLANAGLASLGLITVIIIHRMFS